MGPRVPPLMSAPREGAYGPLDFVVVRAPLLPITAFHAAARATADARLATATCDERIRESLAVGAADLLAAMDRLPTGRQRERLDASLHRYLIRMSTRPTPYGLFAGVALAEWGDATDLRIATGPRRTRTRVDMGWLIAWVGELERHPEVRNRLRLVANPLAFDRAGRLHLADGPRSDDSPAGADVSIRHTSIVRRTLALARVPASRGELTVALQASSDDATADRVERLLDTLYAQGYLITELRPPLTSSDPAGHVLRVLAESGVDAQLSDPLRTLIDAATARDRRALGKSRGATEPTSTTTHQVDSALPLRGRGVSRAVAAEAARAVDLLLRLSPLPDGPPQLSAYRRAFLDRYGPWRTVPLLELIDPERGLGSLDAVPLALRDDTGTATTQATSQAWQGREQALLDLAIGATGAAVRPAASVELDETLVARLALPRDQRSSLPASLELNVLLGAPSARALDAGWFTVVVGPNVGAMEAGRGLGRFADLLGEPALAALAGIAERLPAGADTVDAELVYLPAHARAANVAVRPSIHAHEIVVGASPGVEASRVIPLDQLAVAIRHDRLALRWVARDTWVRVHAGHMLNTVGAPPVCRLLAELGQDGLAQLLHFDWGSAERLPFLPRVNSGRLVLRPAQWRVHQSVRSEWRDAGAPDALATAVATWRRRWRVPRYVHLGHADNRLMLDLTSADHLHELRDAPRGAPLILQEALPVPAHHWMRGPGGAFAVELVVPVVLRAPTTADGTARDTAASAPRGSVVTVDRATRVRAPGSDWLFAKLYGPPSAEDDLLVSDVAPLCERIVHDGGAHRWFFMRYADDAPHLRIRIQGDACRLTTEVMPEICALAERLMGVGRCDRLAFDTYEREVERYGGPAGIDAAERVFAADSRAVALMLDLLARRALSLDRSALAIVSIDRLLAGLGVSEAARLELYGRVPGNRHLVGDQYRRRKQELRALLSDERTIASRPGGDELLRVLDARDAALAQLSSECPSALPSDGAADEWYASVVHLHCNRLVGRDPHAEASLLALLLRTRQGLAAARPPHLTTRS